MNSPPAASMATAQHAADQRRPWTRHLRGPSARVYGWTFGTEFVVVGIQLVSYGLAAHWLGQQGFSEYALSRRVLVVVQPVMILGLTVALPRFTAYSNNSEQKKNYLGAALALALASLALWAVALTAARGPVAHAFFGSAELAPLIPALTVAAAGLCLHGIAYGFFRGHLRMGCANALQLVNLGVVPVSVFVLMSWSVEAVLAGMGMAWAAISVLALVLSRPPGLLRVRAAEVRELLGYGLPRVPGNFFLMALFLLPASVAAHLHGVVSGGQVAFATAMLGAAGSLFSPVGLVLLPQASRMLGAGDGKALRRHVELLLLATVALSALITVASLWLAAPLLRAYLGADLAGAAGVVRIVMLATVPYALYLVSRSVLDAFHYKAVNTRNLFAAILVYAGVMGGMSLRADLDVSHSAGALVVSFGTLGALSAWETWKVMRAVSGEAAP